MCIPSDQLARLQVLRESLVEDETEVIEGTAADETAQQVTRSGKTLSTGVVSIIAYLIGVPEENFGKKLKHSVYEELEKNSRVKTMRALCSIRNAIMQKPGSIYHKMRMEIKNLDTIPELIDPSLFEYLNEQKIRIVTGTQIKELTEYIALINNHISNNVNNCLKLLPAWVNRDYVRSLLVMPNGSKKDKIQSLIDTMKDNFNSYPYACYINWPITRADAYVEDPENYLDPVPTGNVLANDRKFLVLLYRVNGDSFQDFDRVYDASEETKNSLTNFLQTHDDITLLVDCENSDPYKLCAMFDFLREMRRQYQKTSDEAECRLGSIRKIILFDDFHTIDAWDILEDYVHVPVVHEEVERVLGHKSLVDIAMSVGACKEHLVNRTNSFMIAASDSDYWGLIRALSEADFMVLAERSKFSPETQRFYDEHGVNSCLIDDFAGNLNPIKEGALRCCVEKHINNLIAVNILDTLNETHDMLRLDMSTQEKENFQRRMLRNLKVEVDESGEISIHIAE